MTAQATPSLRTILARALVCHSRPERAALVAECCGQNSVLKHDLQSLLECADELFSDEVLIHELGTRLVPFSRADTFAGLKSMLKHAAEARRLFLEQRPCGYGG